MKRASGLLAVLLLTASSLARAQSADAIASALPPVGPVDGDVPSYVFRVPAGERIPFHGVLDNDDAGLGANTPLYVAPGLVGLAAVVMAHGMLVNSQRSAQDERRQQWADEVLKPYAGVLDEFQYQDLLRGSLDRMATRGTKVLVPAGDFATSTWLIESQPTFLVSQDRRAVIVDTVISIYAPDHRDQPAYRNRLRVVSPPRESDDLVEYWGASEGARLKEESAQLLAESFDIALALSQHTIGDAGPARTLRYLEGGRERMERGELLDEHCGRLLVKTLRGSILSMPAKSLRVAMPADCKGLSATAR